MPCSDEKCLKERRRKGSDKMKERYDRNGGYSSKHLRIKAREMEIKREKGGSKNGEKN